MSEEKKLSFFNRLRKRKILSYNHVFETENSSFEQDEKKQKSERDFSWSEDSSIDTCKTRSNNKLCVIEQDENDLTEYELIRQRNIEERKKIFCDLNIEEVKREIENVKKVGKTKRKKIESPPLPPREKSLRLQKKDPSGQPLPENESPRELSSSSIDGAVTRKPSGPLPMQPASGEVDDETLKKFMESFEEIAEEKYKFSGDLEEFRKKVSELTLSEERVHKVVPSRVYSIAAHPSKSKLLLAVGDKWGNLGFWDVHAEAEGSVQLFQPHVGPVNCTTFSKYSPAKIYTTSHDGTVRCGDANKLVFDEIYASNEDESRNHTTWHCETEESCILVAHGTGKVAVVDTRSQAAVEHWYKCHERSVRTVQLHPLESQYFITSSALCEVKIWDRRHMKQKSSEICTLTHPKGLTSAFFSPEGKSVVTTCNDDRLRVYDVTNFKSERPYVKANIRHNTHTGRWLTTFKAAWHPQRDDIFIVGSMEQPRRMVLYNSSGQRVHQFMGDNLASVCSICLFHPTQEDIVIGGNSSGRVHVFM